MRVRINSVSARRPFGEPRDVYEVGFSYGAEWKRRGKLHLDEPPNTVVGRDYEFIVDSIGPQYTP